MISVQKSRAMQAELENEWPGPAHLIKHASAFKHGKIYSFLSKLQNADAFVLLDSKLLVR
jgi:hypothetical protein